MSSHCSIGKAKERRLVVSVLQMHTGHCTETVIPCKWSMRVTANVSPHPQLASYEEQSKRSAHRKSIVFSPVGLDGLWSFIQLLLRKFFDLVYFHARRRNGERHTDYDILERCTFTALNSVSTNYCMNFQCGDICGPITGILHHKSRLDR